MKRAQIYLEDGEYEVVREAAFKRHLSVSSILRQLIQENLGKPSAKRRPAGLDAIIGIVHETKTDVAERHDDYLWGEEA